ncbi:GTP-binding 1 [Pelobates cultripes]|uniref:GTP-binding 1 n=1 Tax=Pelobates cultripes TaxID=61616 RepID=A0AAD1R2P0_PELCU|nr:GTP-binding 1 [Pelobates cultripes]
MASPSTQQPEPNLCESPVPASMFSPEPEAEDSDCSLDGEPMRNGEADLDLTSKHVLVSPSAEQYDSLLQQLRDRMDEGRGETIYVIGQGSA